MRERAREKQSVITPSMLKPVWVAPDLSDKERKEFNLRSGPNESWRTRIVNIQTDPNYVREARPTDVFPLQIEQTGMELFDLLTAVEAYKRGILTWTFIPHGSTRKEEPKLTLSEIRQIDSHDCKDHSLVSRVIGATRLLRKNHKGIKFWYGRRLSVWPSMLLSWKTSCIVITPPWTSQGPNGSLVIEGGPNHNAHAINELKQLRNALRFAEPAD